MAQRALNRAPLSEGDVRALLEAESSRTLLPALLLTGEDSDWRAVVYLLRARPGGFAIVCPTPKCGPLCRGLPTTRASLPSLLPSARSQQRLQGDREFLEKRVGLADHRTLAYFATFMAFGWQMARESGNVELEAFCGRGTMMIEQMVLDGSRPQGRVASGRAAGTELCCLLSDPEAQLVAPLLEARQAQLVRCFPQGPRLLGVAAEDSSRAEATSRRPGPRCREGRGSGEAPDQVEGSSKEAAGVRHRHVTPECSAAAQERRPAGRESETPSPQFLQCAGYTC